MAEPAKKAATYEDLCALPENMMGEIINGELIATPRPSRKHIYATSVLGVRLGPSYHFGEGGPGGWIILIDPELSLGEHILVPDLAGWKKERVAGLGMVEENWIPVAPDWVCEVLSPGTARMDKTRKMPIYARHAVPFLWFIDPVVRTLDVFGLESGRWTVLGSYAEDDRFRAEPFQEVELHLLDLWWE
jgi:Uma2 family endonuclease